MLRKTRFKSLRMRKAALKTQREVERAKWERLAKRLANDNRTFEASLAIEKAKQRQGEGQ